MPWKTPSLQDVRSLNRNNIRAALRSGPLIPNSVLRVMADSNAGLAYLTLLYLDWLSGQLLPDTSELSWLLRWAQLKGVPIGLATYASGTMTASGIPNIPIPKGALLTSQTNTATGGAQTVTWQVTTATPIGASGSAIVPIVSLTPGQTGLSSGATLSFAVGIAGANGSCVLASITDGVDAETEDEIRANVLSNLREPPMGGDAEDYVQWAKNFPGVTRAWCSPQEMGIGTVTLRFMMDQVCVSTNGFPTPGYVQQLQAWIDSKRPVTALDCFVVAPVPYPISFTLNNLDSYDVSTQANITASVQSMLLAKAAPAYALNGVTQAAQTIYAVWVSDAVYQAVGVDYFDLVMTDQPMPNNGSLAVLGNIILG